jgi:hypothetical protein
VILLCASGCESPGSKFSTSSSNEGGTSVETRNNAASLLYDLLGDEKNVSKVLLIKRERRELHDVIKRVAETCGVARERLEQLAREDRTLNLKDTALPPGEKATRDAESKARAKQLLHASGADLEFELLLSQAEALGYAQYLALVAARNETTPARRETFLNISDLMKILHGEVTALLREPLAAQPK